MNRELALFLGGIMMVAQLASANSVVRVNSSHDGQHPYEVVYQSDKTETNAEPGIYSVVRGKEDSQLILPGKVLDASKGFNGVLGQLSNTQVTRMYESLAVVDGRLVLFAKSTSPKNSKSWITFGGNTPIIDAITGVKVPLEPITSTDAKFLNIRLIDDFDDDDVELILVSIQQKNIMGSGITFAVLVTPNANQLELMSPPIVFDYSFHTANELNSLNRGNGKILSRSHILSLTQSNDGDDRILKKYREQLAILANELRGKEEGKSTKKDKSILKEIDRQTGLTFSPPIFNLLTRRLEVERYPIDNVATQPFLVWQRVDPFSGQSGIFFGPIKPEFGAAARPMVMGRIDYNSKNHSYQIVDLSKGTAKEPIKKYEETVVAASIDQRPHLLIKSAVRQGYLGLDISNHFDSEILFGKKSVAAIKTVIPDELNSGHQNHFIFLSSQNESDKTYVLKVVETNDYIKIIDVLLLQKKFSSVSELMNRIRRAKIDTHDRILFDNVSIRFPKQPETILSTPFIDVAATTDEKVSQVYLRPYFEQPFLGNLTWKFFNPNGALVNKTGFYLKPFVENDGKSALTPIFMQGTLLTAVDKEVGARELKQRGKLANGEKKLIPDKFNPITMDYTIDLERRGIPSLKAKIFPYLAAEDSSKTGFRLGFHFHGSSMYEGQTRVADYLTNVYVPIEFSRFRGLKLIQGRRQATDDLSLLIYVGEKESDYAKLTPSRGGPGVMVMPFKLQVKSGAQYDELELQQREGDMAWIHNGELSPQATKNRIHFDANGNAVWVMTPELERTDRNYKMYLLGRVQSEKPIFPNQGLGQTAIRYDEGLEETWNLMFDGDSRWRIDFPTELEVRFPTFAKLREEQRKIERGPEAKKRRNSKREDVLFPDLNAYLNEVSDIKTKNSATVLLVEPDLYPQIRNSILQRLTENDKDSGFNLDNKDLRFYAYDPVFPPDETVENLQRIGHGSSSKDLLFVDMETLVATEIGNSPPTSFRKSSAEDDSEEEDEEASEEGEETEEEEEGEETSEDEKKKAEDKEATQSDTEKREAINSKSPPEALKLNPRDQRELVFGNSRFASLALEGDSVNLKKFSGTLPSHRFSTIVLATPAQWRRHLESFPDEAKAGVFNRFKLDARFLTASWTTWGPKSSKANKEILDFNRNPISKDEYSVFKDLERIMLQTSKAGSPAKHQLLVVPEEIKSLITKLIMTRWASDAKDMEGPWNYKNRNLNLFQVNSPQSTQESIFDNYDSMRGSLTSRRPVLLADMADLLKIGRPSSAERPFRIIDPMSVGKKANSGILSSVDVSESPNPSSEESNVSEPSQSRSQIPHILWWIASEGKKIQPKRAKNWQLKDEITPEIPTLIVTTERELETLQQDANFENRFIDLKSSFETVTLSKPTEDDKRRLLEELFSRPEVAQLNYTFAHENHVSADARKQLIGLVIGKVEQISRQLKIESTYAFLKIYVALKKALTEDVELRRAREINASYLFRLFSRIFPLPLSYEILRADDPLQKFRDHDRAARDMTELGYEGAIELKTRGIRALTNHTRGGTEAGRKIPSSLVLIGEGGTGKTLFIETVIKLAGSKLYDFNKPFDEDVAAMVIRVQDITEEDDPAHPEKLSLSRVKKHIDNFLSMPMGWRGLLLFDDLHKAGSTKILKELMTIIQTLFEAQNGLVKVRRLALEGPGELKEIPVRNLQLAVTLNPTKDRKKRERFLDNWGKKDPVLEAVAAITRDDYEIESSVFTRFADVIDLSEFPREAKVPSVLRKMREANHQEFSAHPRVVAVTPRTLDALVDAFPKSNARDFLSPATFSLLALPNGLPKAPIYIIDPSPSLAELRSFGDEDNSSLESKVDSGQIDSTLKKSTVVQIVRENDPRSKLHLLSFLVDNFRGLVYNHMVVGSQTVPEVSGNHESRVTVMVSFLAAVVGNIAEFPRLPIANVHIKPQELGAIDYDDISDLQQAIQNHSSNEKRPTLNIPAYQNDDERIDLQTFLGLEPASNHERKRLDILIAASQRLQKILEPLLASTLQVENFGQLAKPHLWIDQLNETDPKDIFKKASAELVREYLRFSKELYDRSLLEMRNREGIVQMQIYDEVRLFLLCIDNAIAQLPWSYVTQFILRSLELATTDLSIGQKMGLQHFLFKSAYSPMSTVTPDSIISSARGISTLKTTSEGILKGWTTNYQENCGKFLINTDVKTGETSQ